MKTHSFKNRIDIVGAGIAGLSAAIVCSSAGREVRLWELEPHPSKSGFGLQLGPNAVRLLYQWGLADALKHIAYQPHGLVVHDAVSGKELAHTSWLDFPRRYGAPYLTLARSDLHQLLFKATQLRFDLRAAQAITHVSKNPDSIPLQIYDANGVTHETQKLLICDGSRSRLRESLLPNVLPKRSPYIAYRTTIDIDKWPTESDRTPYVNLWLGPDIHLVHYPIRAGHAMNVVAIVRNTSQDNLDATHMPYTAISALSQNLRDCLMTPTQWSAWPLYAHDEDTLPNLIHPRIALLGDAAHTLLPFLAQGAAMAIEDAAALSDKLDDLEAYAKARQARIHPILKRSEHKAAIFHAKGPLRRARNLALQTMGPILLSQDWLYREAKQN